MERLARFWRYLRDHRLQVSLIGYFSLIAAVTIIAGMLVTSRIIRNYLDQEAVARVRRGMSLAQAIYQDHLVALISSARRVAAQGAAALPAASAADEVECLRQWLRIETEAFPFEGNRFLVVVDARGQVVAKAGYPVSALPAVSGNWGELPLVADMLADGHAGGTTEVLPASYLRDVGLADQALVVIRETPKAAPEPYDPREGTAGLVLMGAAPILDASGKAVGVALAGHLLNNEFALVDRIKETGRLDTVTVFFGDLRVSTNVMTAEGLRALGTRVSQEVGDVALRRGEVFEQRAFVVNEWYITRYEPLRDHRYQVVGSLYVGMREAGFLGLVSAFNDRIVIIAAGSIIMAFLIAVPVARSIIKPLSALVEASHQVAEGDMSARVAVSGRGELAALGESFNDMVANVRAAREELLRKEKLASVGQLAAGVAHEINNPLGTILLYADTMRRELPADDPRQRDFKMIMDETVRCKRIVGDLLNFARQRQLMVKRTDLNALVEQTVLELAAQPGMQGIQLAPVLDPALPAIEADESQIRQVLVNLLLNAADAMSGKGRLTVTTRPIAGETVELTVRDTGAGIPPERMKDIFTPFFTTKPVGKGTGLGLSIVYGIIKMHQGQITVDSVVGQGTTFTITLPTRLPGNAERIA